MKTKIYTLAIIALIAIFCSCSKEKTEKEVNFFNPYNFIGEFHNLGLSSIKNDFVINDKYKNLNEENINKEVIRLSDASYRKILSLQVDFKNTLLTQNESFKIAQTCIDLLGNNQLKSGEFEDVKLNLYVSRLKLIISDNCLADSTTLFGKVHDIEAEVYNNESLSDIEKEQLLITFAVGKFSWLFWKKEFESLLLLKSTNTYQASMLNVVNSDIEGGIAGAITGAYIGATGGTIVGPAGTLCAGVSGCVSGAAVGALSASAVTGIKELWNSIF